MQIEYYNMENLHLYINDENNREIICSIVDAMRDVADKLSYDNSAVAREIVKFVQDVIEILKPPDRRNTPATPSRLCMKGRVTARIPVSSWRRC